MKCGLGKVMGRKARDSDKELRGEERGENIMSGKFQPKISLRNAYLYKVRCDCE